MIPSLQELKMAAASLPAPERVELANYLLHSLDDQEEEGAHAAWLALAERRMAEVRSGKVVGVPGQDVVKHLLGPRS
jgi:putative addiction module component (TIGR02574 family)